jgi:hypothetical protein
VGEALGELAPTAIHVKDSFRRAAHFHVEPFLSSRRYRVE